MVKHGQKPNWWLLGMLCAVCIIAGIAVALVVAFWPRSAPTDAPVSSFVSVTQPSVVTTTTTTTTTTAASSTTATTTRTKFQKLSVTSHKANTTTDEPFTVFRGTSDPDSPLTINGQAIQRDAAGAFAAEMKLTPGKNTFVFSHKGADTTYVVTYNLIIVRNPTPSNNQRYKSGSAFTVSVQARVGSIMTE